MRVYPLQMIEDALTDIEADIRSDGYSGRGMYGQTCAAIGLPGADAAFWLFAQLGYHSHDDDDATDWRSLSDLLNASRTDSMGTGIVIYFPGWTFA